MVREAEGQKNDKEKQLLQKVITGYTAYNHWANEVMCRWLQTLDSKLLYTKTLSSFENIDLTLKHMNEAQNFWFAFIAGPGEKNESMKSGPVDDIFSKLLAGSQKMFDKFSSYREEDLVEKLSKDNMIQSRYEYILQAINHNTYHRGQIVTMSCCLGIGENIPATDYDIFLWSAC